MGGRVPPADGHGEGVSAGEFDRVETEAAEWWLRCRQGMDGHAAEALERWLRADPRHRQVFEELQHLWSEFDEVPRERVNRPTAAVSAPQAARAARRGRSRAGARLLRGRAALFGMAAMLAIAAGWGWRWWQQQPTFDAVYATVRGQQHDVRLPDGSRVQLDADTRAEVSFYRDRRQVVLRRGRSMYTVQRDSARPFDVLAGALRIRVVGTRFAVRYESAGTEEGARVEVEEGRVKLFRAGSEQAVDAAAPMVELRAGQAVTVDALGRAGAVTAAQAGMVAPWRHGRAVFDDATLAEALDEFRRYGDPGVVINDPAVAGLRITGSFDLRRFDSFVNALTQMLPVELRHRDGATEIARR